MTTMSDSLVTVASFTYPWEADLARSKLEAADIPAFVTDAETVSLNWFLSNALGGVRVRVPKEYEDKALAVLNAEVHAVEWVAPGKQAAHPCPQCGANESTPFRGRWWLPFVSWLVGDLPLLSRERKRKCHACGYVWKIEEDE